MPVFIFKRAVFMLLLLLVLPMVGQCSDLSSPSIVINLPSRTLELYSDNTFIKEYPVAIGKPSTPTPLGSYSIMSKEVNPVWMPPRKGYVVESGPDNPLGYRWMGFLPLYGIHGTNAPWTIGLAVSNGCVRMNEEDAEELFEIVSYGTPVRVTYDRIKVRIDQNGQATIGIYPDIYGYRNISLGEAYVKLAEYGLSNFVSEEVLLGLIEQEADKQVPIAHLYNLKVNDNQLPAHAVQTNDAFYVPVWAVAGALKSEIVWDETRQIVRGAKRSVPGVVKGDVLYVSAENLQLLFGGQQVLRQEDNTLEINVLSLLVNDKLVSKDIQLLEGVLAVQVLPLADALRQKVVWDADKGTLLLNGKPIPYGLIDNQPYIQITKINEYFKAYVYWNQQAYRIELTYPIK